MKYYQNKNTGELLASLDELLDLQDPNQKGHVDSLTRVVFPNRQIGNGIKYQVLSYNDISNNFKRINIKLFFSLCPDFGQYRHHYDNTCDRLDVPKRKKTFGLKSSFHENKL